MLQVVLGAGSDPAEPVADWVRTYLQGAVDWASDTFLAGGGHRRVDAAVLGPGPMTVHDPMGNCVVIFQQGSNDLQLRNQAGHEAFHVVWGKNVFHWTHEIGACLASYRVLEGSVPEYADHVRVMAAEHASAFSAADMRAHPVPHDDEPTVTAFYARARLTGIALEEIVGFEGLAELFQAVGEVSDGTTGSSDLNSAKESAAQEWINRQEHSKAVASILGFE